MQIPDFADIEKAANRIGPYAHRTPVLTCQGLNEIFQATLFFKCENFQKVGAFKFRGACNAVFSLPPEQLEKGVATHSSGNHGAALALAASMRQAPAYIVMPSTAPKVKKEAVKSYGAHITFCQPTLESREKTLAQIVAETGAETIHPYHNADIIAGQGTAAMELITEIGGLDAIIAPVGGGGLLSGTLLAANELSPTTVVYGAEPEGANDAQRSLHDGKLYPSINPITIADGLLTSLGQMNFEIIRQHVTDILTTTDEQIVAAMRLIWERMKIIVEPSAAIGLAVLKSHADLFKKRRVGIILSGGNLDLTRLPWQTQ